VLLAVVLINALSVWRAPEPAAASRQRFHAFAALVFLAFAATLAAGEFLYLKDIGYILRGRYFLPALVGLAPLVLHRVRPARIALLAILVCMNLLLMHATVVRCYGGDYATLWLSMPFVAAR
jgi:hypothetical protein